MDISKETQEMFAGIALTDELNAAFLDQLAGILRTAHEWSEENLGIIAGLADARATVMRQSAAALREFTP